MVATNELFLDASPESVKHNYQDDCLQHSWVQGHAEPLEGPSVLQLGGSDTHQLQEVAQAVLEMARRGGRQCDYTAINLNCNSPKSKVAGKGCSGAALMDDSE
jgi:tRNA-dihydrouridine synthase